MWAAANGRLFANHVPDAFYDACDEFGVLVYHDLQFAVSNVDMHEIVHELYNYSANYTRYLAIVQRETTYQIQRLSHHPAIVMCARESQCPVSVVVVLTLLGWLGIMTAGMGAMNAVGMVWGS